MVGLKVSSEELKDIIEILGLADDEQGTVYICLLSLGMATLGQLSLVSGLDFIQTQEALNVLIGSNLVKRIPGKIGRYIALQPFLKAFLLAYDPITLYNVRKDSKKSLQNASEKLQRKIDETNEKFQIHSNGLVDDFSGSLKPIAENFSEIFANQQKILTNTNETLQSDIQMVKDQVQTVINQATELYDQIISSNIVEIEKMPVVFKNSLPEINNNLQQVQTQFNVALEKIRAQQIHFVEEIDNNFRKKMYEQTEGIQQTLDRFNSNLTSNREKIEETVFETKNKLESIKNDANKHQPKFNEIKEGYNKVNLSFQNLVTLVGERLKLIEGLVKESISDVQSRKMFRGKEEFIHRLTSIEKEKESISSFLKNTSEKFPYLEKLNTDLVEIEEHLVQATNLGVDSTFHTFEERRKMFRDQFSTIEKDIDRIIGKEVNESLLKAKQYVTDQIMVFKADLDHLIRKTTHDLESELIILTEILTKLVEGSADELKVKINSLFTSKKSSDIENSELHQMNVKMDELDRGVRTDLNDTLKEVIDLESSLQSYFLGLKTFTASYADTQLGTFMTNLKESQQIVNGYLLDTEKQFDNEVSALMFTIKEMKQKLEKITNVMKFVEIDELDPSLLDTDLVIGETVIILLLRDLTMRTKSSLTVLMPRPELQTLMAASKLPFKTRVNIIGDFRKVPKTTLKKVISSSNVRLKQLDGIDFWGCIRDTEELLICPEPKQPGKEELIGVITTNGNLIQLFSQEILTYTTKSNEILPSDLE